MRWRRQVGSSLKEVKAEENNLRWRKVGTKDIEGKETKATEEKEGEEPPEVKWLKSNHLLCLNAMKPPKKHLQETMITTDKLWRI